MSKFFSLEPMTRAERIATMVTQVECFGACAEEVVIGCRHLEVGPFVFGGAALMFAAGVGMRVKRKITPRSWE